MLWMWTIVRVDLHVHVNQGLCAQLSPKLTEWVRLPLCSRIHPMVNADELRELQRAKLQLL